MTPPFPLVPVPGTYTYLGTDDIFNMIYPGTSAPTHFMSHVGAVDIGLPTGSITVRMKVSAAPAGGSATGYYVKDYYGTTVTSGVLSTPQTGEYFTVTAPGGGWQYGWYRIYLTGAGADDAVFGPSYGVTNFSVVPSNPLFARAPATDDAIFGLEDFIAKAVLGFGSSRFTIQDAANPSSYITSIESTLAAFKLYAPQNATTLPLMVTFPNGATDAIEVQSQDGGLFSSIYPKDDTIDPYKLYISTAVGTAPSSAKLIVYYPNSSTVVETYDNLLINGSNAEHISAASSYVFASPEHGTIPVTNMSAATTPTTYRDGVTAVVQALYPLGISYYEGPSNEPRIERAAAPLGVFRDSVHMGDPNAKAIGPAAVSIIGWDTFLDNGGGDACDEFSAHPYQTIVNGDINQGRAGIETFRTQLASYGVGDKVLWNTEPTHVWVSVAGVYHPRRSRVPVLMILLWEQYNNPRNKNIVWYDKSGGFWAYPAWYEMGDGSLNPYGQLLRILAAETFDMPFHHRLDFGSVQANAIFLGSVYRHANGTETAVIQPASYIPSAQVILNVAGSASTLVMADGFGNETVLTVSGGKVTVPVTDVPSYVRLPAGNHVTVSSVNDWGASPPPTISTYGQASIGGVPTAAISDGAWETEFPDNGVAQGTIDPPDTAQVLFNATVAVDRVLVWAGQVWQTVSTLVKFDVQTTTDHTNWTTRKSVDLSADAVSFKFGSASTNAGCSRETYWTEQWIFDVKLPATYNCNGVRLNVTQTSYGGEPDAAAIAAGGQGSSDQRLTLQEIAVPSASTPAFFSSDYPTTVLAESSLQAYYRFGEAPGATTAVSQVNSPSVDGTYTNYTSGLGVPGAIPSTDTAYKPADNNGCVIVPFNTHFALADEFTIEFWANGISDQQIGQSVCNLGLGNYPHLYFKNGVLQFNVGSDNVDDGVSGWLLAYANAAATGGWHHFAVTKNGSTRKIYMDGTDVTVTGRNVTLTASSLFFGMFTTGFGAGYPYHLTLDEFAFYNTELSAATVLAHYQAGSVPASAPGNVVAPALEGGTTVGEQVGCLHGQWSVTPTSYSYQWQKSNHGAGTWSNVSTGQALLLDSGVLGKDISCLVTATNPVGSSSAVRSNVFGPIT